MNTGIVTFGLVAILVEHYQSSFQRFALQLSNRLGEAVPQREFLMLVQPKWMGFTFLLCRVSETIAAVLLWRTEGWIIGVGYATLAFCLFGVFVPPYGFTNHYSRIAAETFSKNVGSRRAEMTDAEVRLFERVMTHLTLAKVRAKKGRSEESTG